MKKKKNSEGYNALHEKLKKLENIYSSIREKLKIYGYKDSSENGDWIALDEERMKCQSQINLLKAKMARMNWENDEIITYKIVETEEEKTVRLTNGDTDADQGKISRNSPVGKSLSHKKVGEISEVKTNYKNYKIKIININKK